MRVERRRSRNRFVVRRGPMLFVAVFGVIPRVPAPETCCPSNTSRLARF
jgi:hypothetical protein